MDMIVTSISLFSLLMLFILMLQVYYQRVATEALIEENRIRTQLFQDADESTTFILSRTIRNLGAGHPDPNLENDAFALRVVRELVKRKVPKDKWMEIQTNDRLVHELYLLLRDGGIKKGLHEVQANT